MFDTRSEFAQSDNVGLGPSHSDGQWRRAKACTAATCVEVRIDAAGVDLRDSKQLGAKHPGVFRFSLPEWTEFLGAVGSRSGVTVGNVEVSADDHTGVTLTDGKTKLWFDSEEWIAFRSGVAAGEFAVAKPIYAEAMR